MKTNKFLILLPILASMLLTAGCGQADNSDGQADISSAVENVEEFEPVPVPEDGWTFEEVAKTIYINGKQISYPFTIESLGEGYSYKKKTTDIDENGLGITILYYNKTPICTLGYSAVGDTRHLESEIVDQLFIHDTDEWGNKCEYEMIKANGVGLFDDVSAAKVAYGEPNNETESGGIIVYFSDVKNKNSVYFISKDEKITDIGVRLTDK